MRHLLLFCVAWTFIACDDDDSAEVDLAAAQIADAAMVDAMTRDAATADAAPMPDAAPLADAVLPDALAPDALGPDAALPPIGAPDRTAPVFVPEGIAPADGWPIAVVLHGFRSNPELTVGQFPFGRTATEDGWIVVYPRGLPDENGALHWDDYGRVAAGPGDDVPHILSVIDQVAARHDGDVERVLVIGHSNGGAMAQHLACQVPDRLQAFVNLSGVNIEPERCTPARRITGVWAHGTEDDAVLYDGRGDAPGVEAASAAWAASAGCGDAEDLPEPVVGYTLTPPNAPTAIRRWPACDADAQGGTVRVERWRIDGAAHVLLTTAAFSVAVRALLP
ncbi:MAG: poly(3-hydroxybutyrate) depolymerase [Bradymonadia bacterium]|jgi:poly(3-hydroxybutyrate) depolymerase